MPVPNAFAISRHLIAFLICSVVHVDGIVSLIERLAQGDLILLTPHAQDHLKANRLDVLKRIHQLDHFRAIASDGVAIQISEEILAESDDIYASRDELAEFAHALAIELEGAFKMSFGLRSEHDIRSFMMGRLELRFIDEA